MSYNYAPKYKVGNMEGEAAQKVGLGTANNIMQDRLHAGMEYAPDITGQKKAPAQLQTSPNVGYKPMGQISGIGANGYDRLEQALQAPILRQGEKAQQQVADNYGGRGLYGSVGGGLMSGAQAATQQATQDALSNTVGQRYNLELADKAQMMEQNRNLFEANARTSDQQNMFNQLLNQNKYQNQSNQNQFFNQNLLDQQQYLNNRNAYYTGQDEMNFQRALQLAGMGNSGAAVAANQQNAQAMADAQSKAALYGGIGSVAGGLLGNYDSSGNSGWQLSDLKFW